MATFTSSEFPNFQSLNKLIANWNDLDLTQDQRKDVKIQDKYYPLLPMLSKYKKAHSKGSVPIEYKYSKGNPTFPGRQFSQSASMQGMKRWIRHTLATGYYDYDIVNCHPTLFVQLCKKKGWDTTPFESYLEKRDEYLKELMDTNAIDRDEAKEIVLSILNGGAKSYKALAFKPMWLTNYKNAVEMVQLEILGDPENKELLKTIKKNKTYNLGGSIMNCLLCEIENKCLMEAIKILDVKDAILCFDGFMSKKLYNLETLGTQIFESTGYKTAWLIKPMNEGIDLSKFEEVEEDTEDDSNLGVYKEVLKANPNYIKKKGSSVFIFNEKNGMWSQDKDAFGIWMNMCEGVGWGQSVKTMRDSFALTQKLDDSSDFFIQGKKLRLGKILYKNGVKNIENDTFEEKFNHEYFFTKVIPRNYNPIKNEVLYTKTLQTLFFDPHKKENAIELLKALGLAMTGRNPEEAQYDNLGFGSNGKSLLMEELLESFPGYVEPFNITTIKVDLFSKPNAHNDSKVMMADTRIGLSSEGAAGMLVDSEQFKRLTTQEAFFARECGEKQVKIKPEMTLFSFAQQPLMFDKMDKAIQRRRRGFPWNRTFEKCRDGSLDFLKNEETYQAVDHIIQYGYNMWKKDGFLDIEELRLFKEELDQEQDVFTELLEEKYVVVNDTEDKNNWVKSTEIYKTFKPLKLSDFIIKRKFELLGVKCSFIRIEGIRATYFQGLTKVKPVLTIDENY